MKKATKPKSKTLRITKLYLDDIRKIYEIIGKDTVFISFQIGDYGIESIDDLDNKELVEQKKVKELEIKSTMIDIHISDGQAILSIPDSEDKILIGQMELVKDVIRKRASWTPYSISVLSLLLIAAFAIIATILSAFGQSNSIGVVLLILVATYAAMILIPAKYTDIYLIDYDKRTGIFRENKREILFILISNASTGVITFVVGWFLGQK